MLFKAKTKYFEYARINLYLIYLSFVCNSWILCNICRMIFAILKLKFISYEFFEKKKKKKKRCESSGVDVLNEIVFFLSVTSWSFKWHPSIFLKVNIPIDSFRLAFVDVFCYSWSDIRRTYNVYIHSFRFVLISCLYMCVQFGFVHSFFSSLSPSLFIVILCIESKVIFRF